MEDFLRCEFGGLTFGGAYTWRGFFSEFCLILFQRNLYLLESNECQNK